MLTVIDLQAGTTGINVQKVIVGGYCYEKKELVLNGLNADTSYKPVYGKYGCIGR